MLDHIFTPVRMDVLQTGVFDKGISDHAAITAVTHIKRLPKDNFVKTREVQIKEDSFNQPYSSQQYHYSHKILQSKARLTMAEFVFMTHCVIMMRFR